MDLRVRPVQSVDLCFPLDGIIGFLPITYWADYRGRERLRYIYPGLSQAKLSDPAYWYLNSDQIYNSLFNSYVLCSLGANRSKADIDNAIGTQQKHTSPHILVR